MDPEHDLHVVFLLAVLQCDYFAISTIHIVNCSVMIINISLIAILQVLFDNIGIGVTIGFILLVSVVFVTIKIIFFDPPIKSE